MSLACVRPEFVECPTCKAKLGSPALCRECLERRELFGALEALRRMPTLLLLPWVRRIITLCPTCNGTPDPECKEHGR
jgi:hypothetical protein